jgi:hypothetical protein
VKVEESLVAGRENHIVTNALAMTGNRKTPILGIKKKLAQRARDNWSAHAAKYGDQRFATLPDQNKHLTSWLLSPGLHPVAPNQLGSTNKQ